MFYASFSSHPIVLLSSTILSLPLTWRQRCLFIIPRCLCGLMCMSKPSAQYPFYALDVLQGTMPFLKCHTCWDHSTKENWWRLELVYQLLNLHVASTNINLDLVLLSFFVTSLFHFEAFAGFFSPTSSVLLGYSKPYTKCCKTLLHVNRDSVIASLLLHYLCLALWR